MRVREIGVLYRRDEVPPPHPSGWLDVYWD